MKRGKISSGLTLLEYLCYIAIFSIFIFFLIHTVFVQKACASKDTVGQHIAGTVNRAQQAYYEEQGRFMTSLEQVEKYLPEKSEYWKSKNQFWDVSIQSKSNITIVYAIAKKKIVYINGNKHGFSSYVGAVAYDKSKNQSLRIICRATKPGTVQLTEPILQSGRNMRLICLSGTDDC